MVTIVEEKGEKSQTSAHTNDIINRISPAVEQRDEKRAELARILLDDEQKEKIISRYGAINVVDQAKEKSGKDDNLFLEIIHHQINEIAKQDRLLATAIGKAIHALFEKDSGVERILTILARYPEERVFQHFGRYYDRYKEMLESSKNTYLVRWVKVLMDHFLNGYRGKTHRIQTIEENKQRIGGLARIYQDKDRVIEDVKFVVGNIEKLMGEELRSIAIKKPAVNINPLIHLMTYPDELVYLRGIRDKVVRGMKEEEWEEFKQVKKESQKEIAKILERTYGDDGTAKKFREWGSKGEEGLHDDPKEWANKINDRMRELELSWKDIFSEAMKAFAGLFEKCRLIVQSGFEERFDKIKEKANALLGKKQREPKKTAKKVMDLTVKRRKDLDKEISKRREEYEKGISKAFPVVSAFKDTVHKYFIELGLGEFIREVYELRRKNIGMTGPVVETSKRFTGNPTYDMRILGRLKGFASGIMANDRGMLKSALKVKGSASKNYEEVIEKQGLAIKALDGLIADLSNLIGNNGVR